VARCGWPRRYFPFAVGRRTTLASSTVVTGKFANLVDAMVEFVRVNISEEFLVSQQAVVRFIAALFFFILFTNLIGKLPLPFYLVTPTGDIS